MTSTPCPSLRLVEETMYQLERENHELLSATLTVEPDGWTLQVTTDQGKFDFHMDVWGLDLSPTGIMEVAA